MKKTLIFITLGWIVAFTSFSLAADDRYEEAESTVFRAFEWELDREPTRKELYHFVNLVVDEGWGFYDIRRDLRELKQNSYGSTMDRGDSLHSRFQDHDYPSYTDQRNHYRSRDLYEARRWVESGFEEYVGRLPSKRELAEYGAFCLDRRYDRNRIHRVIRDDYEGAYEPYGREEDYCYDFDRYSGSEEVETIIREVYMDTLGREPDTEGLRNYRSLMIDEGWSERRLRDHLANSNEALWDRLSKVVHRAYEDLLDRTPSRQEVDGYVDDIVEHKWSERKLRDMIRQSREYRYDRPRKLIQESYEEVLLREADAAAYNGLTQQIVRNNWGMKQVKDHLRNSSEYRYTTIPKMVRMAYEEVLGREPDASGERFYLARARDGWTFEEIKQHMRESEEYRNTNG